ncbi:MAG: hypothetical protein ACE362_05765 [Phaeodactylibacter xiamenensis]|uniref:Uncharacterized protein n=1 Tax=Phaeodactylibacter xiamenensis TaxID=1524460 RepID=A0A098RZ63_9BACT|nr:hypothetical protein [Phaeodactylibacter xiamenensis]KGE85419.1 hypothetical protein IX84_28450 [Phaeodactylibacter xiamenensis]MCR9050275.1 hypothetical protein [bacterium]
MRFLIACLTLLILSACSGEKPPKEDEVTLFSSDWDSTTALVTDQVTGILKAQESAQELLMALDSLPEAPVTDIKTRLEKELQTLGEASEASFAFVNRWQEGATRLNAIKESGNGTLSASDLKELQQLKQEGQQQAKAWASQLDSARVLFEEARMILE